MLGGALLISFVLPDILSSRPFVCPEVRNVQLSEGWGRGGPAGDSWRGRSQVWSLHPGLPHGPCGPCAHLARRQGWARGLTLQQGYLVMGSWGLSPLLVMGQVPLHSLVKHHGVNV